MNVILLEPEIPQNTGNIGRTCCATGTKLHLIEPMGFRINEKNLEFKGKSKTDFALNLICGCSNYCVPEYIKSGLKWLNEQRVLK